MELVTDVDGQSAPRLGEVASSQEVALEDHSFLMGQGLFACSADGPIHGDLSGVDVLVGRDCTVIIDLPQAGERSRNNSNAFVMLIAMCERSPETLGEFVLILPTIRRRFEMWSLSNW